jgi:hypothetical protein
MSFANPSGISIQDITSSALETSALFSSDGDAFAGTPSSDFERDLEKQQQHHLAQFLYYQGLALQRQAYLASNDNSDAIDNLFNNVGTSPDTLSSESLEDQLHDFVTPESFSESSVSTPSTPDLLGTNINSLSGKNGYIKGLADSPDQSTQARSVSGLSMSGNVSSPRSDGNMAQTGFQAQDMEFQATHFSRHPYNVQVNLVSDTTAQAQYPLQRGEEARLQPFMFDVTASIAPVSSHAQAYASRNRSSSIAVPYMNTFPQAMSNVYMSSQPALYQPYAMQAMHGAGVYDGSLAIPTDGGYHQRTFSLPNNNLSMTYGNPAISLSQYQRAQASIGVMQGNLAQGDLQRNGSIGPQRQEAQLRRTMPYDRTGSSSSRSSFSGSRVGGLQMVRTPEDTATTSPGPIVSTKQSSSGSSTPGATVIPENLKDVPVNMIRNPHGGGRGYVPGETPEDPKKKHKCGICGRGFARLYNLKVCCISEGQTRMRH